MQRPGERLNVHGTEINGPEAQNGYMRNGWKGCLQLKKLAAGIPIQKHQMEKHSAVYPRWNLRIYC